jgi:hypothetical protein
VIRPPSSPKFAPPPRRKCAGHEVAVGRCQTSGAPLAFAIGNRACGECPGRWRRRVRPRLSRSRVWPLSQGRPNAFLAQKHCSEPLMIVEPEISFCRRDAAGADPRGAVISSADTERACGYDRHCNRNRDCSQLLDGWHDHLHPDPPYHLVLLIPNTGCELAHRGQRVQKCRAAPGGEGDAPSLGGPPGSDPAGQDDRRGRLKPCRQCSDSEAL